MSLSARDGLDDQLGDVCSTSRSGQQPPIPGSIPLITTAVVPSSLSICANSCGGEAAVEVEVVRAALTKQLGWTPASLRPEPTIHGHLHEWSCRLVRVMGSERC
jgi:hypothetical protein